MHDDPRPSALPESRGARSRGTLSRVPTVLLPGMRHGARRPRRLRRLPETPRQPASRYCRQAVRYPARGTSRARAAGVLAVFLLFRTDFTADSRLVPRRPDVADHRESTRVNRKLQRREGKGAIELIEEAVHALRL